MGLVYYLFLSLSEKVDSFHFNLLFWLVFQVDYTTVFVFRMLMFVDNGLAAGMGL